MKTGERSRARAECYWKVKGSLWDQTLNTSQSSRTYFINTPTPAKARRPHPSATSTLAQEDTSPQLQQSSTPTWASQTFTLSTPTPLALTPTWLASRSKEPHFSKARSTPNSSRRILTQLVRRISIMCMLVISMSIGLGMYLTFRRGRICEVFER